MSDTSTPRRLLELPIRRRVAAATPPVIRPSVPFRVGWALVIVVVVAFRWWTVSQWSFFQDDWILMTAAGRDSLGHFMATTQNGHLIPGGAFFLWVFTSLDPLNYTWLALMSCALTVLVLVGWGLALRELFGERLHLVAALALIGLSPPVSTVALWWSGNVFFYPLQAATGFALWFLARYLLRGGSRWDQLGLLLSVALGLFFWNKSVLVAIPLAYLPLLVVAGSWRQRVRVGVRALGPTAVLVATYLLVFVLVPRPEINTFVLDFPIGRTLGQTAEFYSTGVSNIVAPLLVGGPFGEIASPYGVYDYAALWLRVLCLALLAITIVAALYYRQRAGWALLMAGTYVAASWGLVLFSSRYDITGVQSTFEGRYSTDMVPVLVLAAMFVLTGLRQPTHEPLRRSMNARLERGLRTARLGYVVLAACLALGISVRNWDSTQPNSPEPWVRALVADVGDLGPAVLYDSVTPANTLNPIFYFGRANLSDVLSPLGADLSFNEPVQNGLLVADDDGHLSEGEVGAPVASTRTPGPVRDCGYLLKPGRTTSLPLDGAAFDYEWVVQIDYFTAAAADVTVRTDHDEVDVTLAPTAPGSLSRMQYVVVDSVKRMDMTLARSAQPVCVTVVDIGPLNSTDRRPSPLEPLDP